MHSKPMCPKNRWRIVVNDHASVQYSWLRTIATEVRLTICPDVFSPLNSLHTSHYTPYTIIIMRRKREIKFTSQTGIVIRKNRHFFSTILSSRQPSFHFLGRQLEITSILCSSRCKQQPRDSFGIFCYSLLLHTTRTLNCFLWYLARQPFSSLSP